MNTQGGMRRKLRIIIVAAHTINIEEGSLRISLHQVQRRYQLVIILHIEHIQLQRSIRWVQWILVVVRL